MICGSSANASDSGTAVEVELLFTSFKLTPLLVPNTCCYLFGQISITSDQLILENYKRVMN